MARAYTRMLCFACRFFLLSKVKLNRPWSQTVSSSRGSFSFPAHSTQRDAIFRSRNMKKPMRHSLSSVNACQRPGGTNARLALEQPPRAGMARDKQGVCTLKQPHSDSQAIERVCLHGRFAPYPDTRVDA